MDYARLWTIPVVTLMLCTNNNWGRAKPSGWLRPPSVILRSIIIAVLSNIVNRSRKLAILRQSNGRDAEQPSKMCLGVNTLTAWVDLGCSIWDGRIQKSLEPYRHS